MASFDQPFCPPQGRSISAGGLGFDGLAGLAGFQAVGGEEAVWAPRWVRVVLAWPLKSPSKSVSLVKRMNEVELDQAMDERMVPGGIAEVEPSAAAADGGAAEIPTAC